MQRRKYALLKQPFELDALGDVSLTNPVVDDVMYYNGTFWINTPYKELVDDRVAALLVAGNNIDITYNDGAGTITIDVETLTSADISDFNEAVDDRVSSLIVAGNNIDVTYNDGSNTFTIDVEGLTSADISDFTEAAQDAVGTMVSTTGVGVDLVYADATPSLTANLDINGLTEDTSPDTAADYLATYDASAGTHKKVLLDNLGLTGGGGGSGTAVNDGAYVYRDASGQSIAHNTVTALTFNNEVRDDGAYFDSGANSRFTITNAGWYALSANCAWSSNTTGVRLFFFRKDGTTQVGGYAYDGAIASMQQNISGCVYLAAGSYIEACVYQNSGSSQTMGVTEQIQNFAIHRLSAGAAIGDNVTHVDAPPVSPDSTDDEFEGTTLASKWAWRNQGSASAAVASGALTITAPALSGDNIKILEQSVTGSWKYRAKVAVRAIADFGHGGMCVINSSNGKVMTIGKVYASGELYFVPKYTSVTAYSSALVAATDWVDRYGSLDSWCYFEIEYDGTTIYFRVSGNGVNWDTLGSEAAATFLGTPDKIGLYAVSNNASNAAYLVCDWFRKIGATYTPGTYSVNAQLAPADNPVNNVVWLDDFITNAGWSAYNVGTGSAALGTAVADHPGVLTLTTGGTGTVFYGQSTDIRTASVNRRIVLGTNPVELTFLFRLPNVPDGTNDYFALFGLIDSDAQVDRVWGAARWTGSACRWAIYNTAASTGSSVDASTGPSNNTWYKATLVMTSSLVTLKINDTSVATLATNIPTAGMTVAMAIARNAGSTARTMEVDYVHLAQDISAGRF